MQDVQKVQVSCGVAAAVDSDQCLGALIPSPSLRPFYKVLIKAVRDEWQEALRVLGNAWHRDEGETTKNKETLAQIGVSFCNFCWQWMKSIKVLRLL
jgi:hypothetical protein